MITMTLEQIKANYPNSVLKNQQELWNVDGSFISNVMQQQDGTYLLINVAPSVNDRPTTTDSDGPLQL